MRAEASAKLKVLSVAVTLVIGMTAVSQDAQAQSTATESTRYDIPAGSLADCVRQLGVQSHLQVLAPPELTTNLRCQPVAGTYTATQVLERVLAGSGLTYEFVNAGTVVIRSAAIPVPTPKAAPTSDARVGDAVTLGSVTVTARKRDERQLDVPIAMNAITGEQIEAMGMLNVADVVNFTPGASAVNAGGGLTQVQIRGVSSSWGGNDNGYYIDESPFTGVTVPIYPDTRSFDIDRVEILKGPQGTLFGEGSMGGTVRILTRKPEFDAFRAGVELDASNVSGGGNGWGTKAYVNVPLVEDRLALRVVATDETTPGWIDNTANGRKEANETDIRTTRAKLRFAPSERWSIDLAYWRYSSDPTFNNYAYDDMTVDSSVLYGNEWISRSLTNSYDFAGSQVVYALSDLDAFIGLSGELMPGLPVIDDIDIGVRTHELRWASIGERRVDWTVGYYLRDAKRDETLWVPGLLDTVSRQTNDASAVFGEVTVHLHTQWALTAGLRYFEDKVVAADRAADGSVAALDGSYDSWNPRLSLAWKPRQDTTLYASAAKGFRSAQLQPIGSIQLAELFGIELPAVIDADSIWTYELGLKSLLVDGKVLLDAAVYYSDWQGVPQRVPITPVIPGLTNSEGVKVKGAEASVVYTPIRALTLQLGASYADASYIADVPGADLYEGGQNFNVPKVRFNVAAGYQWDVGQSLRGVASGMLQRESARETPLVGGTPGDASTQLNARIGLESPSGWAAYLYANNLTDEAGAYTARNAHASGDPAPPGTASRLQPRTVGALFRYDY